MGLESFAEGANSISEETTVEELIDIYGEEIVTRGLAYMDSLEEADKEFRENTESDYATDYAEGIGGGDISEDKRQELNDRWSESIQDNGLGINDDEE